VTLNHKTWIPSFRIRQQRLSTFLLNEWMTVEWHRPLPFIRPSCLSADEWAMLRGVAVGCRYVTFAINTGCRGARKSPVPWPVPEHLSFCPFARTCTVAVTNVTQKRYWTVLYRYAKQWRNLGAAAGVTRRYSHVRPRSRVNDVGCSFEFRSTYCSWMYGFSLFVDLGDFRVSSKTPRTEFGLRGRI